MFAIVGFLLTIIIEVEKRRESFQKIIGLFNKNNYSSRMYVIKGFIFNNPCKNRKRIERERERESLQKMS